MEHRDRIEERGNCKDCCHYRKCLKNPEMAKLARAHNNANILVLSELFTDEKRLFEIVEEFLSTDFEGGRHKKRLEIITNYEENS